MVSIFHTSKSQKGLFHCLDLIYKEIRKQYIFLTIISKMVSLENLAFTEFQTTRMSDSLELERIMHNPSYKRLRKPMVFLLLLKKSASHIYWNTNKYDKGSYKQHLSLRESYLFIFYVLLSPENHTLQ